jgi:starch phosphorylase
VPLFYNRDVDNLPREWIARMKNCMRKLVPFFNTNRMVQNYTENAYLPAFERGEKLAANGLARAVALAKAKDTLRGRWRNIRIVGVHTSGNGHFKVGDQMQVEALVDTPGVKPEEVQVQLYAGRINATGEIEQPHAVSMQYVKPMAPDRHLYVGRLDCRTSGRQGFAIRIVPGGEDFASPFEPGLITWN